MSSCSLVQGAGILHVVGFQAAIEMEFVRQEILLEVRPVIEGRADEIKRLINKRLGLFGVCVRRCQDL